MNEIDDVKHQLESLRARFAILIAEWDRLSDQIGPLLKLREEVLTQIDYLRPRLKWTDIGPISQPK